MDSHEEYNPLSRVHLEEDIFEANHFTSQQIVQTEESVDKLSLQSKGNENDEKVCFQSQQNKPLSCSSEMPLDETKQSKKRGSMSQVVAKTEELESLSEKVRHPTHENGVLPCRQLATPAENGDKQCGSSWPEKTPKNVGMQIANMEDCETESPQDTEAEIDHKRELSTSHSKQGKYFYYDSPHYEETGIWIPVSIPPMSESEHEEWTRGFCSNGGYTPEGDSSWGQCIGEDKEMTMWDVVVEMLLVARGKVSSFASGDIGQISWISNCLIEQAWKEMAQTLTEANFSNAQEILEAEPPKWLPDSAASSCMLCSVRFHPIMCTRHHCRFCGGIFCGDCTKGRSLLPAKFRAGNPQRVCDVCCVRLETVQPYLMDQVSRAAQLPTHDMTDLSTLRSWINFPWGQTMEYEIYKATNTICCYNKVGSLGPERRIPEAILQNAKGLAILTVVKVGMMVTYNIGTGLVVARRDDGTWSAPSAISSFGVGWGAQAGGELTDFIVVLRTSDAVKTFSSDTHLSVGAGLSAAIGIIGRTAEADMRAGANGYAACYTYSCSKGAFIGCSLEGSVVTTRARENSRFYGSQLINAPDILLGSLPRPPAAATLYRALGDLYQKLQR
ncbi:RING/FYVE/PHD-type zinc finger family protein [Forsythia ovata]|uniref:RING/FYVE/PHD-type zinc finger family protein n=1 Tax=Forsythia ovata TaxID=205694 RepID=A0ABD1QG89_9LAMI